MAIVSYIDFVNDYLIKNGMIGNSTNMNKAADQLKKEIDEVIAGNKGTDILTKLKLVDGTGSGLDADLLDGKDSATTNIVNTIVARDGTGNFSAGTITAALTGNASTASTLQTARTINGVSFNGSANITVSDSTAVKLTGDQTIAGIKTFSSNIVGNITGNSGTATKLANSSGNWSESGAIANVVGMLSWKNYGNGYCIFDASAGTAPNGAAVNNTNPQDGWTPTHPTLMGWNGAQTYGVRVDSARVSDSTTYASAFTTAVGSAPSYACRAWVNFNGTGTVAIRASGNVSSITDNGTGDYTVNFTTAMPDANYSSSTMVGSDLVFSTTSTLTSLTASNYRFVTVTLQDYNAVVDRSNVHFNAFR